MFLSSKLTLSTQKHRPRRFQESISRDDFALDAVISSLDGPEIERLKYEHRENYIKTVNDAFENDPLQAYLSKTPDASDTLLSIQQKLFDMYHNFSFTLFVKDKLAYTVHAGDAVIVANPAEAESGGRRPSKRDALLLALSRLTIKIRGMISSKEQRRRNAEAELKFDAAIKDAISSRMPEMLYIGLLATSPAHQGKGYGSALVKTITDMADEQGRATYLISSNILNTGFYNSCGFVGVADVVLGDNNPTWHKKPVIVKIMVREFNEKEDQKLI